MSHCTMVPRETIGRILHNAGLSETDYGYVLRTPRRDEEGVQVRELGLALGGTLTAMAVAGFMLVPWLVGEQAVGVAEIVAAVALLAVAVHLLRSAKQGRYLDTEVDLRISELRIVRRNARGASRVVNRIPFNEVRSVFVLRNKMKHSTSLLRARVNGSEQPIDLVRGSEEAMSTLHRRLVRDLHNSVETVTEVRPTRVRPERRAALA